MMQISPLSVQITAFFSVRLATDVKIESTRVPSRQFLPGSILVTVDGTTVGVIGVPSEANLGFE